MPSHLDTIRHHCLPLLPVPTEVEPVLRPLRDTQAVLFDVYGTLFVSSSGDVGTAAAQNRSEAFREALLAVGVSLRKAAGEDASARQQAAADYLLAAIREAHQPARAAGVEYPEVDIVAIWRETLARLGADGRLASEPDVDLAEVAVQYEVRANPTWPMPGAADCLHRLSQRGVRLGIISNAQFFTRDLFPALLGQSLEELGIAADLQFYSYQWGSAKPGRLLFQHAADALSHIGIPADNVVYIGNDMLNDIAGAQAVGFRTALFAGDARSLRLRSGDARVAGTQPDVIVTHLSQLTRCIV